MRKTMFLALLLGLIITCLIPEMGLAQRPRKVKPETIWKQAICPKISTADSVLFYNSDEIRIEASFLKESFIPKAGSLTQIDSSDFVSIIIPAYTAGKFANVKQNADGKIVIMYIDFYTEERVYQLSFSRVEDGSFVLRSMANLVFRGKNNPITPVSTNPCKLLIDYNKYIVTRKKATKAVGYTVLETSEE